MLHNGYLESARALGGWISKASTKGTTSQSVNGSTDADPLLHGSAVKEPPDPGDARTPGSDVGNLSSPESLGAPKPVTNGESAASRRAELGSGLKELFQWPEPTELLLKRRHLRDTIRSGDYLSALEQLETHFRSLSEQDPSISFVLRCHHFIDLVSHVFTVLAFENNLLDSFSGLNHVGHPYTWFVFASCFEHQMFALVQSPPNVFPSRTMNSLSALFDQNSNHPMHW
ncbi:hypothetical protein FGIG_02789 [Fasciola gigantica]|uniref:CTLH domain-containing protein n=1 Tax=Fasciola gigantica TaxID=46835 RepID=A0A504Z1W7_FASGI|nr:hypothetical protein FGIG_02789 [Fasciola gigantica]